jgi:hypothetical protein
LQKENYSLIQKPAQGKEEYQANDDQATPEAPAGQFLADSANLSAGESQVLHNCSADDKLYFIPFLM